ncbi:MAG: hypothetical protein WAO74_03805 [Polaribacter sp.]
MQTILGVEDVEIYSYRPFKKKDKASLSHFTEKDISWKGEIKKPHFNAFLEKPFDLLIGYFNKENLYNQFSVLKSKATFKTGISKVNQDLYDLEISEYPTNTDGFLLELKKYLLILKKLKN